MSEETAADLKQFIAGAISQSTFEIRQDIKHLDLRLERLETRVGGLEVRIDGLESRINGLEVRIDGLEVRIDSFEAHLGNIEGRVGNLETKVDEGFNAIAELIEDMNTRHNLVEASTHDRVTSRS
jgi:chromosome segregation ATPase